VFIGWEMDRSLLDDGDMLERKMNEVHGVWSERDDV